MPGDDITEGIDEGIDQVTDEGAAQPPPVVQSVDELDAVARFIVAQITAELATAGLPAIVIAEDEVPMEDESATPRLPCIVMTMKRGTPRNGVAAVRLYAWSLWLVRVIDESENYQIMAPVRKAIFKSLQNVTGTAPGGGWWIGGSYETSIVRYSQRESDTVRYNYQGGIYRLQHYALPNSGP